MAMNKNIIELKEDHKKVGSSLESIENILNFTDLETLLKDLRGQLEFFRDFTCKIHHKRESEVLFKWLTDQNPGSDQQVIARINSEHDELEAQVENFLERVNNFSVDDKSALLSDVEDFVRMYKNHIDKEEKFIFLIAETIS